MNERNLCVALLIDADNLSGDVIEQAVAHLLQTYGAIDFRRAYSSPQKVIEHTELFRRHAIRPMVNLPTGKNSTDIALAVDAIDLAITEHPDVVVIGSSDSDYAPLAQRLREKGCRVLGIGQAGKTGSESPLAYDEFIDLAHRKAPAPRASSPAPRSRAPAGRAKAAVVALPSEVRDILDAVPGLRDGVPMQLGEVGEALRGQGVLKSKSASPSRLLKRHVAHFELTPPDRPRTVRFLGAER
ncbi:MAG: NYN domain-containing protein [Burkholderiales bacterium]